MRIHLLIPRLFFALLLLTGAGALSSFVTGHWEEYGKAGYYADSLHGRKTASGEKYNKNELTCAHKTLPFGTKVRVTRLDNQKTVVVRVNDRGPFADGYVVDVSRRAAEELSLIRDGYTRVKLEVLESEPTKAPKLEKVADPVSSTQTKSAPANRSAGTPSPAASSSQGAILIKRHDGKSPATPATYSQEDPKPATTARGADPSQGTPRNDLRRSELYKIAMSRPVRRGYGVQVATLSDVENALRELEKAQKHFPNLVMLNVESSGVENESPDYKVIIGPFEDRKTAETRQKSALKKGYRKCFIVELEEI